MLNRRYVRMCFLGMILGAFVFLPNDSHASDADDVDLGILVITPMRSQASANNIPDQKQIITALELQNLPVKNLSEALKYIPGVDIQNSGSFGQSSAVSIRGASSRQVLVMVDGIPFNTQLSGQANISRIPIENIEQIEVIKGGSSSAWGSSLGGVINVVTKPAGVTSTPKAMVSSSFGGYSTSKNNLQIEGRQGSVGYYAFGSLLYSDGFLADSKTREGKSFVKLKYDLNETMDVTGSFGYSGANLRYGPTYTKRIFEQPYNSRYGQIVFNNQVEGHNSFSAAYKFNNQDVTSDSYNSTTRALVSSTVSKNFYQGLSLSDAYTLNQVATLTAGIDSDWHELKSSNYLTKSVSMNSQAPYTNLSFNFEQWDLVPAIRYDHNSHFGSQVSPSLGVVYHVPHWKDGLIRAKVSRVFNAPPLLWLYNNDPGLLVAPNPNLKAERAYAYEFGTEGELFISSLKGQLNLYRSDVYDAIAVVFDGSAFQSQNFNKFVRQGAEARLDYRFTDWLSVFSSGAFNDVHNVQTKRIVRDAGVARQSFKWGVDFSFEQGTDISLQGYYNRWSAPASTPANDRKPIFDLTFEHDFRKLLNQNELKVFVNLYNVTNSSYFADPLYPLPGRYVEGGVSLNF